MVKEKKIVKENGYYINFIHPIANILAQIPIRFSYISSRFYSLLVCIIVLICFAASVYIMKGSTAYLILKTSSKFLQTLLVIYHILSTTFWNKNTFLTLLKSFITLKNKLPVVKKEKEKQWSYMFIQMCVLHLFYISLTVLDVIWFSPHDDLVNYICYSIYNFIEYSVFVFVFLICHYCLSLKQFFEALNDFLKELNISKKLLGIGSYKIIIDNVINTRKIYIRLVYMATLFNTIFGWQILFLYASIASEILQTVEDVKNVSFNYMVATIIFTWMFIRFIAGAVVAITFHDTVKEAQYTAKICYTLLLNFPTPTNTYQDINLKEELHLLAKQATYECPEFTAAGFFCVDHTILVGLFATVTTYIIVLIQFNN